MSSTGLWKFSVHAQSRGASRINLILDDKAKAEISRALDGKPTLITKKTGSHVYEIRVFGASVVAVCDVPRRTVVTVMEAKRFYSRIKNGRGRNRRRRRHFLQDPPDTEFDEGDNHGSVNR